MMPAAKAPSGPIVALRRHWPEYLIEGWALGMFMISAGVFATLLGSPASPLTKLIPSPDMQRALVGLAMGSTAVALIYSPWGKRSGAHMNPAVTLTFLRLGKVAPWDAAFFILAQFTGGVAGVTIAAALLGDAFVAPPVRYVATAPGYFGVPGAFLAEVLISALLMSVILRVSNSARYAKYTGLCAGALVATYITLEAPLSGMSMNPARSFASAFPAGLWSDLWIYFIAPVLGMQAAAAWYTYRRGRQAVACAKLQHPPDQRCIHCGYTPPPVGDADCDTSELVR
jgi:aquaporin Z